MPAPAFSYAQAAKGAAAAAAAAAASAPPSTATPSSSNSPSMRPTQASLSIDASAAPSTTPLPEVKIGPKESAPAAEQQSNTEAKPDTTEKQPADAATGPSSSAMRDSAPPSVAGSGRADEDGATDRSAHRSDQSARSSSIAARVSEDSDRKSRKSRKPRPGDKDAKDTEDPVASQELSKEMSPVKAELFEAPIPTVNVWQQRMGELAARKAQVVPQVSKPTTPVEPAVPKGGEPSGKSQDHKKKPRGQDDAEANGSGPNGIHVNGTKGPRKSAESGRDGDFPPRRNGARGGRMDKESTTAASALPPVGERALWPTPDTSIKEDRRPSLERAEGNEKDGPEASQGPKKKKWEKVDIDLTYKFDTPFQTGRGRGRGGARGGRDATSRGGHATNAGSQVDKNGGTDGGSVKTNGTDAKERRESIISSRAASIAPSTTKPPQGEGQSHRKPSVPAGSASERPKDPTFPVAGQDQAQSPHERRDGQNSRGRGGRRPNAHQPPHIQTTQQSTAWPVTTGTANAFRQPQPSFSGPRNPYGAQFSASQGKANGRGTNRPLQTPGYNMTTRVPSVNGNASGRQVPVQPAYGYDYPISPATTMPFTMPPTPENMFLSGVVSQINYYFSADNLAKDYWLRQNMDSQGFVQLELVARFRRLQSLSPERELLRLACAESQVVDYVVGEDGIERLRRRLDWMRWVLPWEDRMEHGRSEGPGRLLFYSRHAQAPYSQDYAMGSYSAVPMTFNLPNGAHGFPAWGDPNRPEHQPNGHINGNGYIPESQLSAAVPEFSPGQPAEGFGNFEQMPTMGGLEPNGSLQDHPIAEPLPANGLANGTDVITLSANGVIPGASEHETQPPRMIDGGTV